MSQYTPEQLRQRANKVDHGGLFGRIAAVRLLRAHAAALERMAKLERHAEAMAFLIQDGTNDGIWLAAVKAYRADFPKEPR